MFYALMRFFLASFFFAFELYFSKLKKLSQILVTKKSYEICLSFLLILASHINFEYALRLTLSTPLTLAKRCLLFSPFTSSTLLLSMTKVDEIDGPLHAFDKKGM